MYHFIAVLSTNILLFHSFKIIRFKVELKLAILTNLNINWCIFLFLNVNGAFFLRWGFSLLKISLLFINRINSLNFCEEVLDKSISWVAVYNVFSSKLSLIEEWLTGGKEWAFLICQGTWVSSPRTSNSKNIRETLKLRRGLFGRSYPLVHFSELSSLL